MTLMVESSIYLTANLSRGTKIKANPMQTNYYTPKKIMEIIADYHINIKNAHNMKYETVSVGIAQYGDDAGMPRSGGITRSVENEALRQIENTKYWSKKLTDIKYIQDRWYRITEEKDARVLSMRLDGMSVSEIADAEKRDRSSIHRQLTAIAIKLSTAE